MCILKQIAVKSAFSVCLFACLFDPFNSHAMRPWPGSTLIWWPIRQFSLLSCPQPKVLMVDATLVLHKQTLIIQSRHRPTQWMNVVMMLGHWRLWWTSNLWVQGDTHTKINRLHDNQHHQRQPPRPSNDDTHIQPSPWRSNRIHSHSEKSTHQRSARSCSPVAYALFLRQNRIAINHSKPNGWDIFRKDIILGQDINADTSRIIFVGKTLCTRRQ